MHLAGLSLTGCVPQKLSTTRSQQQLRNGNSLMISMGPACSLSFDGLERDIRLLEASIAREEIEFGALCRLQQSTLEVQILQEESELRLQQLHIQLGYLTQRKWTMPVTTTPLLKCRF